MPNPGTTFSYQHVKQGPCLAKELLFDVCNCSNCNNRRVIFAPILVIANLAFSLKQNSPSNPVRNPCAPTGVTVGHYFHAFAGNERPLKNYYHSMLKCILYNVFENIVTRP